MDGCTKQTVDQPEQHRIDIAVAYPDPPVQSLDYFRSTRATPSRRILNPQNPTARESKKPAPAIPISTTIPMPPRLSPEPSPAAPHRKELKPNPVTLATRRARPVRSKLPEKNPLTKLSKRLFGLSNCSTPACMFHSNSPSQYGQANSPEASSSSSISSSQCGQRISTIRQTRHLKAYSFPRRRPNEYASS